MNKEPSNLLFVTPGFPENEADSTCIPALQEFVLGLNKLYPEIDITILTLHYPGENKHYNWYGNKIVSIGANNCSFPKRLFYWKQLKSMVSQLHLKQTFDLIHTFWFDEVTYLMSPLAQKLNIPMYCTFMGQDAIGKNKYAQRIHPKNITLVALSAQHNSAIKTHLNISVENIIPWGISKSSKKCPDKDLDLINIGSFNTIKNQMEALDIISKSLDVYPDLSCVFVGDGPELGRVKSHAHELGIEKNVTFTGKLNRDDIFLLLDRTKILLHSSNYESFGMIFAEAVYSDTMIVSREVGIAEEKPWWKVYESTEAAAEFIIELLKNPTSPTDQEKSSVSIANTVGKYVQLWSTKKGRP
ncbi:glycosyltransferase [Parvicella tangerina]|nr:glycosyltransferase [Parvicella tangerina]